MANQRPMVREMQMELARVMQMNLDLSLPMVIKMEIQNCKVKVKRMATSLGWPKKTVIKRPMETKMVTLNCLARERPKDLEMVMPMRRERDAEGERDEIGRAHV